ncbi:hypothetical protein [Thermoflexus sp.]|uniref:hypothetical protein n=1 Tax=Thermoflexus sp. TaxID=1969742 RepID=UPI00175AF279|nr:hypothetical protein [Thermoflexus sp.]
MCARNTRLVQALRPRYESDVDFFEVRADTREGQALLARFGMPGTHGLVVLDRQGQVIWRSFGHDATPETVEAILQQAIR